MNIQDAKRALAEFGQHRATLDRLRGNGYFDDPSRPDSRSKWEAAAASASANTGGRPDLPTVGGR